jgi:hypothetical protein
VHRAKHVLAFTVAVVVLTFAGKTADACLPPPIMPSSFFPLPVTIQNEDLKKVPADLYSFTGEVVERIWINKNSTKVPHSGFQALVRVRESFNQPVIALVRVNYLNPCEPPVTVGQKVNVIGEKQGDQFLAVYPGYVRQACLQFDCRMTLSAPTCNPSANVPPGKVGVSGTIKGVYSTFQCRKSLVSIAVDQASSSTIPKEIFVQLEPKSCTFVRAEIGERVHLLVSASPDSQNGTYGNLDCGSQWAR